MEKFSANTSRIGDTLSGWCKKLQTAEFPNTVDATKLLIEEQEKVHLEIAEVRIETDRQTDRQTDRPHY